MGNDLFAAHSWYFRNALVRSNYQHVERGICKDFSFLIRFFRNLLLGEKNELRNRYMHVHYEELKDKWQSKEDKHIAEHGEGINEREKQVLARVARDANITAREMAGKLRCSLSAVERALSSLKKKGRLIREGARKNGSWRIVPPGSGENL